MIEQSLKQDAAAQNPEVRPAAVPQGVLTAAQKSGLRLFSGNANRPLAERISAYLGVPVGRAEVARFADGEINVHIQENVRGRDCYVVQPTCRPANETLMELLIMIDALRRASAGRITAVIPYFGYARADRKTQPRVPISAKLVANLLTEAGAQRIVTVDLHAGQIQGFFDIPVDHLYAAPVFLDYLRAKDLKDIVCVSPDVGGVERARAFAKRMSAGLVIIDKRRPRPNVASVYNVIGDVSGKTAVLFDDMIDTGGTLIKVAAKLREQGAVKILAACVHGVISSGALDGIAQSEIEQLIITDTIPFSPQQPGKIVQLSVAPLVGEAIRRNHLGESISELFV
ncbi:MAG: ribose-phosphate pyrophosphokinase [Elusimicrobiota bacterium]